MRIDRIETDRRSLMVAAGVAAATAAVASTPAVAAADAPTKTNLTPSQALARLMEANRRFVTDRRNPAAIGTAERLRLAKGQAPFAALVGCADSRVGPEHLFGAGLGELFIVRTAGNYVDDAGYGSLAYAVAALGVPLIVVLGHSRCGAVAAATELVTDNKQLPPALSRMVQPMLPAVVEARSSVKGDDLVDHAVHINVRHVVRQLRETKEPLIGNPLEQGQLMIVGAYYDLDTGAVDFFDRG
ncbi:MAG TPA: carbonic anhydrase [Sphingopyxis sp.]|jgi:carbonic anhydrase|uniref:carbonic anhydrase n=1 Tax=Sphingopyxis sp. TaxID=1908224 RepID=UPI002E1528B2|nr:carbonic anhydrase [Sphingopyxis sp.]